MSRVRVGMNFGRLTIAERLPNAQSGHAKWLCKCACGQEKSVYSSALLRGATKSCGCLQKEAGSRNGKKTVHNLSGQRFGRLVVIERDTNISGRNAAWLCRCDCGQTTIVFGYNLNGRNGRQQTYSCGCYRSETISANNKIRFSLPDGVAAFNEIYSRYKRAAKARGLKFALAKDKFKTLIISECHYCGSEHSNVKRNKYGHGNFVYNGIDRVDNTRGYIADNVVPCCFQCNMSKGKQRATEFIEWIMKAARHQTIKTQTR
jgi:hypothetical protein